MNEDKSKALAAAAPTLPAPQFSGDKIVFFCSQGHKITVPLDVAGKRGICSKAGCGVPVVIPTPPGFVPPQPKPAAPEDERPAGAGGAEAAPAVTAQAVDPSADSDGPTGALTPGWDFASGAADLGDVLAQDVGSDAADAAVGWGDLDDIDHPTARLVARLWLERAHGGIVEVHLAGGSVILPEWFDAHWSSGSHAVFAAQAADGSVTVTAVAWDQIQKVVVRQVQGTPEGMFET